jgi:molybdopterin-guanine dinucleotide biosynthesis protein B
MNKPFVVCIVAGGRHAGKTTLLVKILREMNRRGLAVGTIKHIDSHSEFTASDNEIFRHIQSGSRMSLAITSSEIIIVRMDLPTTLEAALSQIPMQLDYVLVEGFKQSEYPKIIVQRSDSERPIQVPGDIMATVIDQKRIVKDGKGDKAEQFSDKNIVDIIEGYFNSS